MTEYLSPSPRQQFVLAGGLPASGYQLFTFLNNTVTPADTFVDASGSTPNQNPILLDSTGGADIWLPPGQLFTFALATPTDSSPPTAPLWVVNNVSSGGSVATINFAADTGTVNALVVAVPGIASLFQGLTITVEAANNSTGPVTINVNGFGPKSVVLQNGAALTGGEFQASGQYLLQYTGTSWQILGLSISLNNAQTAAEIAAGVTPTNYGYTELNPLRYGFDMTGATDMTAKFAAIQAVAAYYPSSFITFPPGKLRLDGPIVTDPSITGIDFGGCTIDASHATSTYWWTILPSITDPNLVVLAMGAHPYSNAILVGPSASVNSTALFLDTATLEIAGAKFNRIQFREWITDIIIGRNTFCCTWTGCQFTQTSGIANTSYSVALSAAATGERNTFIDCFWFNKFYLMNLQSPNSDTWFQNCSIDTFYRAFNVLAGQCYVNMCHMENVTDVDVWGYAANPALLSITNSIFTTQIAKTVYDFFTSGSGNTGGVVILNCALNGGGRPLTTYLVGGGGNTRVAGLTLASGDQHPSIGPGANLLAYGTMESSSWAGDWTLSVTGTPTQSNTVAHSGTYSMKLAGSSTTSPGAQATRACVPGQFAIADLWWQAPTMGSSTAFVVALSYTDAAGVLLSGSTNLVNDTAVVSTWTHVQYGLSIAAPPGTVKAILAIYMFGTTAGSPVAYVDDMQFYVA